jgi:hypothetical protein
MSKALGLPDKLVTLISATEERTGLPKGALLGVLGQEVGAQASKFINDPAAYHYAKDASGKRVAKHTGKVSTAFGPFGILESTGAKPGYGVAPLKDKSLEEQVRFAGEYLAARAKQAGSLIGGLAGYGEGAKYAEQVAKRIGGKQPEIQKQIVQAAPATVSQNKVTQVQAPVQARDNSMQAFQEVVSQAPTMSYQEQVAQEMDAFLKMGQPKSEVEALMQAQAQQEQEAMAMQQREQDSPMAPFNYAVPQMQMNGLEPIREFSPFSAFKAWGVS